MVRVKRPVPKPVHKRKSAGEHIKERLNLYASYECNIDVEMNDLWPNFHFSQGHKVDFTLNLPQLFCVLRQYKASRKLLNELIDENEKYVESNVARNAEQNIRPTADENDKSAAIEFIDDVPFN